MSLLKASATVLFILLFSLSGCQVYSNLYGEKNTTEQYVPDSSIKVAQGEEDIASEISQDDTLSTEAKEIANELAKKIEANKEVTSIETSTQSPESSQETEPEAETEVVLESESSEDTQTETTQEESLAVIAQETEKVSLQPEASDPDGDTLLFAFTSPLDEKGEWQTTYGDSGEYTVTVTASDGDLTTTKDVLLIINKKEESPSIDSSSPQGAGVSSKETDKLLFSVSASDLNKDPLNYEWKLDGELVGEGNSFDYQTTYDDSGSHTVKVDVTDGTLTASRIWALDVSNLNRKPVLSSFEQINAKETDTITLTAQATDEDGDEIVYSISDSRFTQNDNVFVWKTDYSSAGSYTITIKATDGEDESSQTAILTIGNVNRKPVILNIMQK